MFKKHNFVILLSILAMIFSTLACGISSSAQPADEQPASSTPVIDTPADSSANAGTDPNAVVPCSQLVPTDEVKNLLINLTPILTENSYAGGTSCTWAYTSTAGQSSNFYLQVDFTTDAVSLWEATRQSELKNEPSDIVVISLNGFSGESYTWSSKVTGLYVIYTRQGDKTLIMRYVPQDVLYMANESGLLDMVDRIFNRF